MTILLGYDTWNDAYFKSCLSGRMSNGFRVVVPTFQWFLIVDRRNPLVWLNPIFVVGPPHLSMYQRVSQYMEYLV